MAIKGLLATGAIVIITTHHVKAVKSILRLPGIKTYAAELAKKTLQETITSPTHKMIGDSIGASNGVEFAKQIGFTEKNLLLLAKKNQPNSKS
jgi:hypothetical protein